MLTQYDYGGFCYCNVVAKLTQFNSFVVVMKRLCSVWTSFPELKRQFQSTLLAKFNVEHFLAATGVGLGLRVWVWRVWV